MEVISMSHPGRSVGSMQLSPTKGQTTSRRQVSSFTQQMVTKILCQALPQVMCSDPNQPSAGEGWRQAAGSYNQVWWVEGWRKCKRGKQPTPAWGLREDFLEKLNLKSKEKDKLELRGQGRLVRGKHILGKGNRVPTLHALEAISYASKVLNIMVFLYTNGQRKKWIGFT